MAKNKTKKKQPAEQLRPKEPQANAPASAQLDALDAPQLDTLVYDGETYVVDYAKVNDIEVLEAFQRGSAFFPAELNGALTALQKTLGAEGYAKFKADQTRKHGSCRATAIFELFTIVDGRAGGNS